MAHNNRKPKMQKFTIKDFLKQFPDDAACLEWLKNHLYPEGITCKNCERVTKHHRVASRPSYCCDNCGNHVHPTAGTIFHKSPTPLTTWFYAMYLMSATRCGISAKQIQRETGVTYKTAWRMFKQIRSMLDDENMSPLGGKRGPGVEMDEMFYGGHRKGGTGRPMAGDKGKKATVIGMVERKGRVRAFVTPDASGSTILGLAKEYVLPKSTVFTDEFKSYNVLHRHRNEWNLRRINHSEKVYVVGDIHTNSIEGFWALVKTGIRGVYHQVGKHYLQSYLNEYSFRYNRRHDEQPMFTSFLKQVSKNAVPQSPEVKPTPVETIPF